eukprot:jgi/Mesvir1/3361/Mv04255-RA.1
MGKHHPQPVQVASDEVKKRFLQNKYLEERQPLLCVSPPHYRSTLRKQIAVLSERYLVPGIVRKYQDDDHFQACVARLLVICPWTGALAASEFQAAKATYFDSLEKLKTGNRKQPPLEPKQETAASYVEAQWSRYLSNHKDKDVKSPSDDDDNEGPPRKMRKKQAKERVSTVNADSPTGSSRQPLSSLTNIVAFENAAKTDEIKPMDIQTTQDDHIKRLERELAEAKMRRAAAATAGPPAQPLMQKSAAGPTIFITPPLPPAAFAASKAKECLIAVQDGPSAKAAFVPAVKKVENSARQEGGKGDKVGKKMGETAGEMAEKKVAGTGGKKAGEVGGKKADGKASEVAGDKAGNLAAQKGGKKAAKQAEGSPPLDLGLQHFLAALSTKATVRDPPAQPEVGLFVAQRYLLVLPDEPSSIIWEIGKIQAHNPRKKKSVGNQVCGLFRADSCLQCSPGQFAAGWR